MAVVGHLDHVVQEADHHVTGVSVVTVLDELGKRHVRLADQPLTEFPKEP